jgi:hypothetical protein
MQYYNSVALHYILKQVLEPTPDDTFLSSKAKFCVDIDPSEMVYDIKRFLNRNKIEFVEGNGEKMLEKLPLLANYKDHFVVVTNIYEGIIRIYDPVVDRIEDIYLHNFRENWIDEYVIYIPKKYDLIDCDPVSYF